MKLAWKIIVFILFLWLLLLIYLGHLFQSPTNPDHSLVRLEQALKTASELRKENRELMKLVKNSRSLKETVELSQITDSLKRNIDDNNKEQITKHSNVPDIAHEVSWRGTLNGVVELWYKLDSSLSNIEKSSPSELRKNVEKIHQDLRAQKLSVLDHIYNLGESNGAKVWRESEHQTLSALVDKRLKAMQNPADCSTARKLICNLNKGCGFGCQIHHVAFCMMVAYGSGRTLILESRDWRYSPGDKGWERVFLPLSDTCTEVTGTRAAWSPSSSSAQNVDLPIVDGMQPRPAYMPQAIPEDLATRLTRLHGHPFVWWVGHFMRYVMRPQPALANELKEGLQKMNFRGPIVGIHVRRTDKVGTEAAFHGIEEYMRFADEFFEQLALKQPVDKKRVYLATDDVNLVADARSKYLQYEILATPASAETAQVNQRYTPTALRYVIMDIHYLSLTDYLVCTFSSQVCRVAYELMQTLHADASTRFHSLDDIYYFGGQQAHDQIAVVDHEPQRAEEIALRAGDRIGIAGNHWDGYSKGTNRRTGRLGLYPSYKARDETLIAAMPDFGVKPDR